MSSSTQILASSGFQQLFSQALQHLRDTPEYADLLSSLKPPEILLLEKFPTAHETFLATVLNSDDPIFGSINAVRAMILDHASSVANPALIQNLESIYSQFVRKICAKFPSERLAVLKSFLDVESVGREFFHAMVCRTDPDAVFHLGSAGFALDTKNKSWQTPLHIAAKEGNLPLVSSLVHAGANPNSTDLDGKTPLHLATIAEQADVIFWLMDNGADPEIKTKQGSSILHYTVIHNRLVILTRLLERANCAALINTKDDDGKTPLHLSMWGDPKPEFVRVLLIHGADPHATNSFHYTPMHWAAKHGHLASAKLLYKAGAHIDSENSNGDTPIDLAIRWGQDDLVRFLIDPDNDTTQPATLSIDPADLEGSYYRCLETSYQQSDAANQIFCLEKLGDLRLAAGDFIKAALLLNCVHAAAVQYAYPENYRRFLIRKLERIEGYFLETLRAKEGITLKTPAAYRSSRSSMKESLKKIRAGAESSLKENGSIPAVIEMLTSGFKKILSDLIAECIELLGQQPPTAYAVIALGSMGRQEMCPYSDIEFAFLLENESEAHCSYFDRLCQLLMIKIINLGETAASFQRPRRVLDKFIEGKSFTPNGFNMDGGLSPLGKSGVYQLIGKPETIASYISPSWVNKNSAEIILENALINVSLVTGKKELLTTYQRCLNKTLTKEYRQERALTLLKGHVAEFSSEINEWRVKLKAFDAKRDLYRPIQMFIGTLAIYYGLKPDTTLGYIGQLMDNHVICKLGGKRLQNALCQALRWRLEAHFFYETENEILYITNDDDDLNGTCLYKITESNSAGLLDLFRVLIPLQKAMERFLKGDTKSLHKDPLYDESIGQVDLPRQNRDRDSAQLSSYVAAAALNPQNEEHLVQVQRLKQELGQYDEALKHNLEILALLKRKYRENWEQQKATLSCYDQIAICLEKLERSEDALDYSEKSLKIKIQIFGESSIEVADAYEFSAMRYLALGNTDQAITYKVRALEIQKKKFGVHDQKLLKNYIHLASIYLSCRQYQQSEELYKTALQILESNTNQNFSDVATISSHIAQCLVGKGSQEQALTYYRKAKDIFQTLLGEQHPRFVALRNECVRCESIVLGQTK